MINRRRSRRSCERAGTEGKTPVGETTATSCGVFPSSTGPEKSRVNPAGPPAKPKYSLVTDSGPVPCGKGEKYPGRGVKEYLKPCAYKPSEPLPAPDNRERVVTACLLKNEPES